MYLYDLIVLIVFIRFTCIYTDLYDYNLMKTDTPVLLFIFLEYVLLFLDDNVDEECE